MVTNSNKSNTPPYIVNLIDRDNLSYGTVDITNFLSRDGFVLYLEKISAEFNTLKLPVQNEQSQIYFIAQENFEAIKIGITKNPSRRLVELQTGNPNRLLILFFYDGEAYHNDFNIFKDDPMTFGYSYEMHQRAWFAGNDENRLFGEWIKPDERTFRMLIRHGLSVIQWHREKHNATEQA